MLKERLKERGLPLEPAFSLRDNGIWLPDNTHFWPIFYEYFPEHCAIGPKRKERELGQFVGLFDCLDRLLFWRAKRITRLMRDGKPLAAPEEYIEPPRPDTGMPIDIAIPFAHALASTLRESVDPLVRAMRRLEQDPLSLPDLEEVQAWHDRLLSFAVKPALSGNENEEDNLFAAATREVMADRKLPNPHAPSAIQMARKKQADGKTPADAKTKLPPVPAAEQEAGQPGKIIALLARDCKVLLCSDEAGSYF